MKPIHVFQCKKDCCLVQVPSKRFWYVRTPKGQETWSSFTSAMAYAGYEAAHLPQEVTA
jgi:hypothetical protein